MFYISLQKATAKIEILFLFHKRFGKTFFSYFCFLPLFFLSLRF